MSQHARSVLALFAHPDDEILCAAGTLALCALQGQRVQLVCATRGELGPIADAALATPATLAQVREAELRCSCQRLGIQTVQFLDLPDSGVAWASEEARSAEALAREIRLLRPDVLITFGPDGLYGHSDHVAVSELLTRARALAADANFVDGAPVFRAPRLFYAVTTADQVSELLSALEQSGQAGQLWSLAPETFHVAAAQITASVEVTAVLERKLAAIRCHRTQLEPDNALLLLTERAALAKRFLGTEHFRCADGLEGDPVTG